MSRQCDQCENKAQVTWQRGEVLWLCWVCFWETRKMTQYIKDNQPFQDGLHDFMMGTSEVMREVLSEMIIPDQRPTTHIQRAPLFSDSSDEGWRTGNDNN